jgi:hypothetical protein
MAPLEDLEQAMTDEVEFPEMRKSVISALQSFASPQVQGSKWGKYDSAVGSYDDLDINVHILYDDCVVLPDPNLQRGAILLPSDIEPLRRFGLAFGPLLDDLGDAPDSEYLNDSRWPAVIAVAQQALEAMLNGEHAQ